MTSETKSDKDIALITDITSGSKSSLLCTERREDVWIADSVASNLMTNTLQDMYNQCKISSKNKIGSREYVNVNIIGDMSGITIQKDGTKKYITLHTINNNIKLYVKGDQAYLFHHVLCAMYIYILT